MDQLSYAEEYRLFPQNFGHDLAIDETSLICGELYTFVINRDVHGGKGALTTSIRGTRAETVISVLEEIALSKRKRVREITIDLSPSMMLISKTFFLR